MSAVIKDENPQVLYGNFVHLRGVMNIFVDSCFFMVLLKFWGNFTMTHHLLDNNGVTMLNI